MIEDINRTKIDKQLLDVRVSQDPGVSLSQSLTKMDFYKSAIM